MEEILEIYQQEYTQEHPLLCFDESSKQQVQEVIESLPMERGKPMRFDSEYERKGTSNLFMIFEPFEGKRHVHITEQRTKKDWAECMRMIVDELYPDAKKITIVMDNLNTHTPASLYGRFSPSEARRISAKLDIQYTPKHGSWLNMAEIEFSALSRQCLNRRIGDREQLKREIRAWEKERNAATVKCMWRFKTEDARIKLKKLYPQYE
jgi:hypothetical protein